MYRTTRRNCNFCKSSFNARIYSKGYGTQKFCDRRCAGEYKAKFTPEIFDKDYKPNRRDLENCIKLMCLIGNIKNKSWRLE